MNLASGLHKAGLVRFLQQLLRERHQAGVFHQTASLCHLGRQRLAAFLPRGLQGLGERSVALGQSGGQVPDALGQLLPGRHAVHLWSATRLSNADPPVLLYSRYVIHLCLSDGTLQLGDLSQNRVLVGQNVGHLLGNLLLSNTHARFLF